MNDTNEHFTIYQLADDSLTYGPDAGKFLVTSSDFEQEYSGPMNQTDAETLAAALNACQMVVTRWESGDFAEAARKCGDAINELSGRAA